MNGLCKTVIQKYGRKWSKLVISLKRSNGINPLEKNKHKEASELKLLTTCEHYLILNI